jgi:prepilin-type N-terminal cleavage/methylation domain-containing protein
MKSQIPNPKSQAAFTLVEMMVALGISGILLTVLGLLTMCGLFSFAAMANYTDLDSQSRSTLDVINREIREATAVVSAQTNLPVRSLTLTNATEGRTVQLAWDSATSNLVVTLTGVGPRTYLTQCSDWNFTMYDRAPTVTHTNILFYKAGTLSQCKLINMTWKCSRSVLVGRRVNTENVQTAQVVLRNNITSN